MQIDRLFGIIYKLLNQQNVTASTLATFFEVSTRTIYRDIETLSSAGIPVFMTKGKGGGISLLPNFVLNKAVFTDDEKADVIASLKALQAIDLSKTDTALKKLSSFFGKADVDFLEVDFSSWSNPVEETAIFDGIKAAIICKKLVEFSYSNSSSETTRRVVEPLKLCFKGQSWYFYGYCRLREDYRFFKLRRVKELVLLEEKFTRVAPPKVITNAEVYYGEFVNLMLNISHEMAFRVYDEFDNIQELPDGSFNAMLTVPKSEWLFGYLLSFGNYVEVLEPKEVRMEIKGRLQKSLNKYL